MGVKGLSP